MPLPPDLSARRLEAAARLVADEVAELDLPPDAADRLSCLLGGMLDAAGTLRAELAPRAPTRDRTAIPAQLAEPCAVFDLRSRQRIG